MHTAWHRIRSQRWLVHTCSEADAFVLRRQLRNLWEDTLLPMVARCFDEVGIGDDVVRIPKLELRVRVASRENLMEALPDLVRDRLRELLRPIKDRVPTSSSLYWQRQGATAASLDALVHFLDTGSLPWSFHWCNVVGTLHELRRHAAAKGLELSPRSVESLARLFGLLEEADWAEAVGDAERALPERHGLSAAVFALTGAGAASMTRHARIQFAAVLTAAVAAPDQGGLRQELQELVAESDAVLPATTKSFVRDWLVRTSRSEPLPLKRTPLAPPKTFWSQTSTARQGAPPAAWMGVQYAGLILLHPFLPMLFDATGALASLERAAALLYYLATGREDAQEFELGFIKILAGLEPDRPLLIASGLLRETDRTEAQALLNAVIEHWSVLKRTSVDGLRRTFLQRPGQLRADDDGWRVRVESAAVDILLDYLPWGVSVAKLPWVSKPIYAEWVAP